MDVQTAKREEQLHLTSIQQYSRQGPPRTFPRNQKMSPLCLPVLHFASLSCKGCFSSCCQQDAKIIDSARREGYWPIVHCEPASILFCAKYSSDQHPSASSWRAVCHVHFATHVDQTADPWLCLLGTEQALDQSLWPSQACDVAFAISHGY